MNTLKGVGVVLVGLFMTGVATLLLEALGHWVFPAPAGLDLESADALRAAVSEGLIPVPSMLGVIVAQALGLLAGCLVMIQLGCTRRQVLVLAGLQLFFCVINLIAIPHPAWFTALNPLVVIAAGWAGVRLQERARPAFVEMEVSGD